jgi:hypothetical protein
MQRVRKRVPCTIEFVERYSDFVGYVVPCVVATCSRCCHQTESIGTTSMSVRECLSLMREECPCGASNEYEAIEVRSPHFSPMGQPKPLDRDGMVPRS